MKAVIFAAGKSTRTYPLTLTRPKPLLPVANKPILEHQLEALTGIVDTALIVVGYRGEMIRERFGDHFRSIALQYVEQGDQKGTGHALLACEQHISEPFIALNGDDLYDRKDLETLAEHENAALVKEVDDPSAYGVYVVDSDDRVERIVEKPTEAISSLANIGAYCFGPEVFDILQKVAPSERGEIEIPSAIQKIADEKEFHVIRAQGYWLPIAYPWDLLEANEHWLNAPEFHREIHGVLSDTTEVNGPLYLGSNSVVRSGVVVDGPVCIGPDCVVGPNTWLRPGTTLGRGCKVGHSVEIKNSILFDGARVPHLSYVGDSILGEDVNLGCGTVIANFRHDGLNHKSAVNGTLVDTGRRKLGAIIGDDVHTGINTSIYPGRKMWPGTSTLPGQVVKHDIES